MNAETAAMPQRFVALLLALLLPNLNVAGSERPYARFMLASAPYATALAGDEIRAREEGPPLVWLKQRSADGWERFSGAVEHFRPDAAVILGSLTWTGSEADLELVQTWLREISVPVYVSPGARDFTRGTPDSLARGLAGCGGRCRYSIVIEGVQLLVAQGDDGASPQIVLDWMEQELLAHPDARARLLLGGPDLPTHPNDVDDSAEPLTRRFWSLCDRYAVAVQIVGGHAHDLSGDRLPRWTSPSLGWQTEWAGALVEVFDDRIELGLIGEPELPRQIFSVPNPRTSSRFPNADEAAHGNPTFAQDLKKSPRLSFVHLADSQFDDLTDPALGARYKNASALNRQAVKQINRLKPTFALLAGDLVNKNTAQEWEMFHAIYGELEIPLYCVPGNHDILRPDNSSEGTTGLRTGYEMFEENTRRYANAGRRSFAFECSGVGFVAIDTGAEFVNWLEPGHVDWVADSLRRYADANARIVFGHYPLPGTYGNELPAEKGGNALLHVLRLHSATAYLHGHRHRASRYRVRQGLPCVLAEDLCWDDRGGYWIWHVFDDRLVACWQPVDAQSDRHLYERVEFSAATNRN